MVFSNGFWPRTSVRAYSVAAALTLLSCSSGDESPAPQQLGNGSPYGQGGFPSGGFGGGGYSGAAAGVPSSGGIVGAGGTVAPGAGGIIGAGGIVAAGGFIGAGGIIGAGGTFDTGGATAAGGALGPGGTPGDGGAPSSGGANGTGGSSGGDPETGRLVGITAAHNAVRAAVQTQNPLPPVTWSPTLAAYAQEWADSLAATSCNSPHHRSSSELRQMGYGENLAAFSSSFGGSAAEQAVNGWSSEVACWTYGAIATTEQCDPGCYSRLNSDGCGHYTQIVWRNTTEIGCGVASCQNGVFKTDIWICNYKPPGNIIGQAPY